MADLPCQHGVHRAEEGRLTMPTSIKDYLERDHQRLDQLLARAAREQGRIGLQAFAEFRRGLLKHIGMEEKILLPTIQAARAGEPLPIAVRLRLQHGAIAALLVPSPRPAVLKALKAILEQHNAIEEGPQGVYAQCDRIAGEQALALLDRLRAAPEVPAAPHVDSDRVEVSARRALDRAGFDPRLLDE
jgi:hypothetical protein